MNPPREAYDQRIGELETQLDHLAVRYSALQWVFEQAFAHYLLSVPDRDEFLDGIAAPGPAYTREPEGFERPAPSSLAMQLNQEIALVVESVRNRVRFGRGPA